MVARPAELPSLTSEACYTARMRAPLLLAAVSLVVSAALPSCTPAARREASAAVSTLAPILCGVLAGVIGPDGATAGLVCNDLSKALSAGLAFARAGEPSNSVARVAARSGACTPYPLTKVEPTRDPREFVCVEAFGGEGAVDAAIRNALATGHAR